MAIQPGAPVQPVAPTATKTPVQPVPPTATKIPVQAPVHPQVHTPSNPLAKHFRQPSIYIRLPVKVYGMMILLLLFQKTGKYQYTQ